MKDLTKVSKKEMENCSDRHKEAYHHSSSNIRYCPECGEVLVPINKSPHDWNKQSILYYCFDCKTFYGTHWYKG